MAKSLTELAGDIACAQASHAVMTAEEMDQFLQRTFETLKRLKDSEERGEAPSVLPGEKTVNAEPDVSSELMELRANPKKSIQRNYVINLEDGKKYKVLTERTLSRFGLTTKEYRHKWGFTAKQPLSAKSLSALRRKKAKELGLGERLKKVRQAKK